MHIAPASDRSDLPGARRPALRRWATWLGLAGLLPFLALAVGAVALPPDRSPMAVAAQIQYAASVLSFIGALHWGIALAAPGLPAARTRVALVWSVVPSLYAVAAVVLPGWQPGPDAAGATLLLLAAGFVAAWAVDLALYRPDPALQWFRRLRTVLTTGATLALLVTLLAR